MMLDSKMAIRKQARLCRGILNLLKDDLEMICSDSDDYNLMALEISINESKDTIQRLTDGIVELEYVLYQLRNSGSRENHTHL